MCHAGTQVQAVQEEGAAAVSHEAARGGSGRLPPGPQVARLGQDGAGEEDRAPDGDTEVAQDVRDGEGGQELG